MKTVKIFKSAGIAVSLGLLTGAFLIAQDVQDPKRQAGENDAFEAKREAVDTAQSAPSAINKVSNLLGMYVRNQDNELLGTIKDIVINFESGQIAYTVLAVEEDGLLRSKEKLIAVPLPAIEATPEKTYLTLNVDKKKFSEAKGFDAKQWPSVQQPQWGAEPFWKAVPQTNEKKGFKESQ